MVSINQCNDYFQGQNVNYYKERFSYFTYLLLCTDIMDLCGVITMKLVRFLTYVILHLYMHVELQIMHGIQLVNQTLCIHILCTNNVGHKSTHDA